ncbi:DUF3098 domain-containing protein [Chitinophaga rhizosphaerae]|uniref:DUF3098 domain-containing protein n=1 Tax=Chitinophaga rhizosphaerae TaxID=1864947 RepID=UPI000F8017E3|nr:DUF3098 domain-containing protein [Chitinophaga rhizosphaerae]
MSKEANKPSTSRSLFGKGNYQLMLAGVILIAIGFLLMMGGSSDDPARFSPEEVYSFRRITLAPIVILLGLAVEAWAIMRKPKA